MSKSRDKLSIVFFKKLIIMQTILYHKCDKMWKPALRAVCPEVNWIWIGNIPRHLRVIQWGRHNVAQTLYPDNLFTKEAIVADNEFILKNIELLKNDLIRRNPIWRNAFSHFLRHITTQYFFLRRKRGTFEQAKEIYFNLDIIFQKIKRFSIIQKKFFLHTLAIYENNHRWVWLSEWQNPESLQVKILSENGEEKILCMDWWKYKRLEWQKLKERLNFQSRKLLYEMEIKVSGEVDWIIQWKMEWIMLWDVYWILRREEEWGKITSTKIDEKNTIIIWEVIWELKGVLIWQAEWHVKWRIKWNTDLLKNKSSHGIKILFYLLDRIDKGCKFAEGDCIFLLDDD